MVSGRRKLSGWQKAVAPSVNFCLQQTPNFYIRIRELYFAKCLSNVGYHGKDFLGKYTEIFICSKHFYDNKAPKTRKKRALIGNSCKSNEGAYRIWRHIRRTFFFKTKMYLKKNSPVSCHMMPSRLGPQNTPATSPVG